MKKVTSVTITIWLAFLLGINIMNVKRNQDIYLNPNPAEIYKTEEEFRKDLENEKSKLGISNTNIECLVEEGREGGHCIKRGDRFVITMGPEYKNKKVLRHELYHAKHWDDFNIIDAFTFGGYEEWRATSYSIEE